MENETCPDSRKSEIPIPYGGKWMVSGCKKRWISKFVGVEIYHVQKFRKNGLANLFVANATCPDLENFDFSSLFVRDWPCPNVRKSDFTNLLRWEWDMSGFFQRWMSESVWGETGQCPDSRKSEFPRWLEWKSSMYGHETKWIYTSVCVEMGHVRMSERVNFQRKGALRMPKEDIYICLTMLSRSFCLHLRLFLFVFIYMYICTREFVRIHTRTHIRTQTRTRKQTTQMHTHVHAHLWLLHLSQCANSLRYAHSTILTQKKLSHSHLQP